MKGIDDFTPLSRRTQRITALRSDHCPAMKGIDDSGGYNAFRSGGRSSQRSDHCPAMKGIEDMIVHVPFGVRGVPRSDHCPAMKGIDTDPPPAASRERARQLRSDHCPAMKGIDDDRDFRRARHPC
jgi:hypothetical protein